MNHNKNFYMTVGSHEHKKPGHRHGWTVTILITSLKQVMIQHCTTAMATFEQSENVESTTRAWQKTDLVSRGSAGHSKYAALCAIHFKIHLYGHICLCTWHCNCDQSWTFWTCSRAHQILLCRLEKDTDYIIVWKVFLLFIPLCTGKAPMHSRM